jgi:hypothetical protein
MPLAMASSKLVLELEMISVTRATDMALSLFGQDAHCGPALC